MSEWLLEIWRASVKQAGPVPAGAGLLAILSSLGWGSWWLGSRAVRWLYQTVWIPIREARSRVPIRTLIVLLGDRMGTFWTEVPSPGGDKPLMLFRIGLHLTNITQNPVSLSAIWLHYCRGLVSETREGRFELSSPVSEHFNYTIPAEYMWKALGVWMIVPPFQKREKPVRVRVRVVDQFGNNHWSKWLNSPWCKWSPLRSRLWWSSVM
jgi:hypothetical protein